LDGLENLSPEERSRFLVMGGECNYLFETVTNLDTGTISLQEIDGTKWKNGRGVRWKEEDIQLMLDLAEKTLEQTTKLLGMNSVQILRKERAVGIINTSQKRFLYENLEEICLTVQQALQQCTVPHCAFNGGNDVWVDVGNKALGIRALQKYAYRFLPKELQAEELVSKIILSTIQSSVMVGYTF
jgi:IMP and pyridine-specific 5'-nucleotidase